MERVERDESETSELRLATERKVGGRRFRFVLNIRQDVWEDFLRANAPGSEQIDSRAAYEIDRAFWDEFVNEVADSHIDELVATSEANMTYTPQLSELEEARAKQQTNDND